MKKLLLFIFLHVSVISYAQITSLKGKVLNEKTLEPVDGATVAIKNTNIKTHTNKTGTYIINNVTIGEFF